MKKTLEQIIEEHHLKARRASDGYGPALEAQKLAILQWVADEVIGEDGDAEEYDRGRGYPQIDLKQIYFNSLRAEQRQRLARLGDA